MKITTKQAMDIIDIMICHHFGWDGLAGCYEERQFSYSDVIPNYLIIASQNINEPGYEPPGLYVFVKKELCDFVKELINQDKSIHNILSKIDDIDDFHNLIRNNPDIENLYDIFIESMFDEFNLLDKHRQGEP